MEHLPNHCDHNSTTGVTSSPAQWTRCAEELATLVQEGEWQVEECQMKRVRPVLITWTGKCSGHTEEYKKASNALRKTIRAAKREYRAKVESQFNTTNTRSLWQGLNTVTDFRRETRSVDNISAALPNQLNTFCARFERVNIRKAAGPDGIPGRIFKVCAHQLAGVFTDISNLSLSLSVVPACFKLATIVPVPKTARITTLRPVALTSIISKCFEKLVRDFICSSLPATLDPLQFAYRQNRSTDDAIALTLHTALSHLDKQNTHSSNVIIKFADDTTIVGLISNNNEEAYREEVSFLTHWCRENNLSLNVSKTKELIVDFRKQERVHTPITINMAAVERVSSLKFLGVHITEELTWSEHTTRVVKKAQQRLFFLRQLRRFGMDPRILRTFCTCTVESILTGSITTWYGNCTAIERKALQRVVQTAQYITGVQLPNLLDLYTSRCLRKTRRILKDSAHPSHRLFSQLPSGRRFRSQLSATAELLCSTAVVNSLVYIKEIVLDSDADHMYETVTAFNMCESHGIWAEAPPHRLIIGTFYSSVVQMVQ
ncbi:hypothetical protein NFI96_008400 [Prochilodus magdalenae]|nr:hypothetical protein NFI96_008400 [Prochilodus magdalenae]